MFPIVQNSSFKLKRVHAKRSIIDAGSVHKYTFEINEDQ